ncbi:LINE-1 retrotransposable element ORF2 protein [Camelus dromedarius]|uniref:LINE-1 retrotransposable element ORF2 protein n=1 Tax=Camelus dromedarius TaxID=9838 RepID=A0A5N4DKU1_CAMDR|nr:LINE-1 retrotransposable element ORF2 protein [Camelus dromedarius]
MVPSTAVGPDGLRVVGTVAKWTSQQLGMSRVPPLPHQSWPSWVPRTWQVCSPGSRAVHDLPAETTPTVVPLPTGTAHPARLKAQILGLGCAHRVTTSLFCRVGSEHCFVRDRCGRHTHCADGDRVQGHRATEGRSKTPSQLLAKVVLPCGFAEKTDTHRKVRELTAALRLGTEVMAWPTISKVTLRPRHAIIWASGNEQDGTEALVGEDQAHAYTPGGTAQCGSHRGRPAACSCREDSQPALGESHKRDVAGKCQALKSTFCVTPLTQWSSLGTTGDRGIGIWGSSHVGILVQVLIHSNDVTVFQLQAEETLTTRRDLQTLLSWSSGPCEKPVGQEDSVQENPERPGSQVAAEDGKCQEEETSPRSLIRVPLLPSCLPADTAALRRESDVLTNWDGPHHPCGDTPELPLQNHPPSDPQACKAAVPTGCSAPQPSPPCSFLMMPQGRQHIGLPVPKKSPIMMAGLSVNSELIGFPQLPEGHKLFLRNKAQSKRWSLGWSRSGKSQLRSRLLSCAGEQPHGEELPQLSALEQGNASGSLGSHVCRKAREPRRGNPSQAETQAAQGPAANKGLVPPDPAGVSPAGVSAGGPGQHLPGETAVAELQPVDLKLLTPNPSGVSRGHGPTCPQALKGLLQWSESLNRPTLHPPIMTREAPQSISSNGYSHLMRGRSSSHLLWFPKLEPLLPQLSPRPGSWMGSCALSTHLLTSLQLHHLTKMTPHGQVGVWGKGTISSTGVTCSPPPRSPSCSEALGSLSIIFFLSSAPPLGSHSVPGTPKGQSRVQLLPPICPQIAQMSSGLSDLMSHLKQLKGCGILITGSETAVQTRWSKKKPSPDAAGSSPESPARTWERFCLKASGVLQPQAICWEGMTLRLCRYPGMDMGLPGAQGGRGNPKSRNSMPRAQRDKETQSSLTPVRVAVIQKSTSDKCWRGSALFTIAKTWKQPKCPSTDDWIKKRWYIYTMKYYSAIKTNKITPFAATWMLLENVILTALLTITKTWKETKCPLTADWIKMWCTHTMEYYSAIKKNKIMPFAATWMDLEIVILRNLRTQSGPKGPAIFRGCSRSPGHTVDKPPGEGGLAEKRLKPDPVTTCSVHKLSERQASPTRGFPLLFQQRLIRSPDFSKEGPRAAPGHRGGLVFTRILSHKLHEDHLTGSALQPGRATGRQGALKRPADRSGLTEPRARSPPPGSQTPRAGRPQRPPPTAASGPSAVSAACAHSEPRPEKAPPSAFKDHLVPRPEKGHRATAALRAGKQPGAAAGTRRGASGPAVLPGDAFPPGGREPRTAAPAARRDPGVPPAPVLGPGTRSLCGELRSAPPRGHAQGPADKGAWRLRPPPPKRGRTRRAGAHPPEQRSPRGTLWDWLRMRAQGRGDREGRGEEGRGPRGEGHQLTRRVRNLPHPLIKGQIPVLGHDNYKCVLPLWPRGTGTSGNPVFLTPVGDGFSAGVPHTCGCPLIVGLGLRGNKPSAPLARRFRLGESAYDEHSEEDRRPVVGARLQKWGLRRDWGAANPQEGLGCCAPAVAGSHSPDTPQTPLSAPASPGRPGLDTHMPSLGDKGAGLRPWVNTLMAATQCTHTCRVQAVTLNFYQWAGESSSFKGPCGWAIGVDTGWRTLAHHFGPSQRLWTPEGLPGLSHSQNAPSPLPLRPVDPRLQEGVSPGVCVLRLPNPHTDPKQPTGCWAFLEFSPLWITSSGRLEGQLRRLQVSALGRSLRYRTANFSLTTAISPSKAQTKAGTHRLVPPLVLVGGGCLYVHVVLLGDCVSPFLFQDLCLKPQGLKHYLARPVRRTETPRLGWGLPPWTAQWSLLHLVTSECHFQLCRVVPRGPLPPHPPPQSLLDILIPQGVDEGVQHRGDDGVEHGDGLGQVQRALHRGPHMQEDGGAVPDEDHCEVGGAGGEGPAPTLGRGDPDDGDDDVGVGDQRDEAGAQDDAEGDAKGRQLHWPPVAAGQHNPGRDVAEEVVDDAGATEGEAGDEGGWHCDGREAAQPGAQGKVGREAGRHDAAVAQRQTDGQVAVVGHGRQQEVLGAAQREDEVHLCHTAGEGDGSALRGEGGQGLGHAGRGEPDLQEGEVAEEEVHGRLQVPVRPDQRDDGQVPSHRERVHDQEQQEEPNLRMNCPWVDRFWLRPQTMSTGPPAGNPPWGLRKRGPPCSALSGLYSACPIVPGPQLGLASSASGALNCPERAGSEHCGDAGSWLLHLETTTFRVARGDPVLAPGCHLMIPQLGSQVPRNVKSQTPVSPAPPPGRKLGGWEARGRDVQDAGCGVRAGGRRVKGRRAQTRGASPPSRNPRLDLELSAMPPTGRSQRRPDDIPREGPGRGAPRPRGHEPRTSSRREAGGTGPLKASPYLGKGSLLRSHCNRCGFRPAPLCCVALHTPHTVTHTPMCARTYVHTPHARGHSMHTHLLCRRVCTLTTRISPVTVEHSPPFLMHLGVTTLLTPESGHGSGRSLGFLAQVPALLFQNVFNPSDDARFLPLLSTYCSLETWTENCPSLASSSPPQRGGSHLPALWGGLCLLHQQVTVCMLLMHQLWPRHTWLHPPVQLSLIRARESDACSSHIHRTPARARSCAVGAQTKAKLQRSVCGSAAKARVGPPWALSRKDSAPPLAMVLCPEGESLCLPSSEHLAGHRPLPSCTGAWVLSAAPQPWALRPPGRTGPRAGAAWVLSFRKPFSLLQITTETERKTPLQSLPCLGALRALLPEFPLGGQLACSPVCMCGSCTGNEDTESSTSCKGLLRLRRRDYGGRGPTVSPPRERDEEIYPQLSLGHSPKGSEEAAGHILLKQPGGQEAEHKTPRPSRQGPLLAESLPFCCPPPLDTWQKEQGTWTALDPQGAAKTFMLPWQVHSLGQKVDLGCPEGALTDHQHRTSVPKISTGPAGWGTAPACGQEASTPLLLSPGRRPQLRLWPCLTCHPTSSGAASPLSPAGCQLMPQGPRLTAQTASAPLQGSEDDSQPWTTLTCPPTTRQAAGPLTLASSALRLPGPSSQLCSWQSLALGGAPRGGVPGALVLVLHLATTSHPNPTAADAGPAPNWRVSQGPAPGPTTRAPAGRQPQAPLGVALLHTGYWAGGYFLPDPPWPGCSLRWGPPAHPPSGLRGTHVGHTRVQGVGCTAWAGLWAVSHGVPRPGVLEGAGGAPHPEPVPPSALCRVPGTRGALADRCTLTADPGLKCHATLGTPAPPRGHRHTGVWLPLIGTAWEVGGSPSVSAHAGLRLSRENEGCSVCFNNPYLPKHSSTLGIGEVQRKAF